jgi:hypothetical protein
MSQQKRVININWSDDSATEEIPHAKIIVLNRGDPTKDYLQKKANNTAAQNLESPTSSAVDTAQIVQKASPKLHRVSENEESTRTVNESLENAKDRVTEAKDKVVENVQVAKDQVVETAQVAKDRVVETAESAKEGLIENLTVAKDVLVDNAVWAKDALVETAEYAKDTANEKLEDAKDLAIEVKDQMVENAENLTGYKLIKDSTNETINLELPKEAKERIENAEPAKERIENAESTKEILMENLEYAKDVLVENVVWAKDTLLETAQLANEKLEDAKELAVETKDQMVENAENLTGYKLVKIDESETINLELPKEVRDRLNENSESKDRKTNDLVKTDETLETINLELPTEARDRFNDNFESKDGATDDLINTAENLTGYKLVKDDVTGNSSESENTDSEKSEGGILGTLGRVLIENVENVTGYKLTKGSPGPIKKSANTEKTPAELAKQIREQTLADF